MSDCNKSFGKEDLIFDQESPLLDSYEMNFEIGHGAFSKVYQLKHKSTGEIRACKYISKENFKEEALINFKNECKILRESDHPNIVKLYEIFETDKSFYLIMENCDGGSLSIKIDERINHKKPFDENILSELFRQIASAIKYIHDKNICHRDLKPDNICFTKMGQMENNTAKLIDFGLGKLMKTNNEKLESVVGSPLFVAPEVLLGNYTKKCDIWSLGVILFILVGGYPPFLGNDNGDTNMKIKKMKYKFKEDNFKDASDEVIDLIKHCLVKEEERFDIEQVLEHKWIKKEKKFPNNTENIYDKLESNLRLYQKMENFEKKIIRFIAMRLNENEVKKLEKFFTALDKDNNGTLSKEEFLSGINDIEEFNLSEEEIQNIFKKIDTNKNKKLEYTEFISAIIDKDIYLNKGKLREVFDAIDKNKNGKISKIDIKNVLNLGENCVKKFENLMEEIGKGKDDEINFDEFFKMICQIISDNMNK